MMATRSPLASSTPRRRKSGTVSLSARRITRTQGNFCAIRSAYSAVPQATTMTSAPQSFTCRSSDIRYSSMKGAPTMDAITTETG